MVNNLIIDCSCGLGVYVVKDKELFSFVDENQKRHTDDLLVVVDKLLNDADLKINQIDNFCVTVGPGSFTGIRVAISMVKGLAVNSNAKIYAISNFDCFDKINDNAVYVLDGFSNFVYARFNRHGEIKDECIDVNELKQLIENEELVVYVLFEKTQNNLNKCEIQSIIIQNNIINAFNAVIESNKDIKLNQICPVYLRASQAEIERNKKLNLN